MDKFQVSFKL